MYALILDKLHICIKEPFSGIKLNIFIWIDQQVPKCKL